MTVYAALPYPSEGSVNVYKTVDGGSTWLPAGPSNFPVLSLAMAAAVPETIYAATEGEGVFVSRDRGESWTTMNEGLTTLDTYGIAVDPSGSALHVRTDRGVFDFRSS